MLRYPRCCVAYPNVFRQPRAIVAPNTMLMQGQKFYIVPLGTIRKLQRLSRSPLQSHQTPSPSLDASQTNYDQERMISSCWLCFAQNTSKQPHTCLEQSDETRMPKEMEKEEFASDEYCFICLFTGIKSIANANRYVESNDAQCSSSSRVESSQVRELSRKRAKELAWKGIKMSYKKRLYLDDWQPKLESINEE
ncbi:hypothetical protein Syun_010917 [Stephania yunnanensis]|uniref:Uncharacterized protein n=1 Tax=Stephania yunnanensis TaxID=152371 RepID=A0AAP0PEY2_9MAGN